jgi:hypothetical protein
MTRRIIMMLTTGTPVALERRELLSRPGKILDIAEELISESSLPVP